jgi:hypothetical protein
MAWGAETPPELVAAVKAAEADGAALFEATQRPVAVDPQDVSKARGMISNFCKFDYKPTAVSLRGRRAIYFLAQSSRPGDIVFGRHFKVAGATVSASTGTCFNGGTPPANALAAFATHLLSPAPTEFHVYLSLKHRKPIFVGTSVGNWAVDRGKVLFMEKR